MKLLLVQFILFPGYSNKIGARFSQDLGASSSQSSLEPTKEFSENEWCMVKGKGFGRGNAFVIIL